MPIEKTIKLLEIFAGIEKAFKNDDTAAMEQVLAPLEENTEVLDTETWDVIVGEAVQTQPVKCFAMLVKKKIYTGHENDYFLELCGEYHYAEGEKKEKLLEIIKIYALNSGLDLTNGKCFKAALFSKSVVLLNPELLIFCIEKGNLIDYRFNTQSKNYTVSIEEYLQAKIVLESSEYMPSLEAVKRYRQILQDKENLELSIDLPTASIKTQGATMNDKVRPYHEGTESSLIKRVKI